MKAVLGVRFSPTKPGREFDSWKSLPRYVLYLIPIGSMGLVDLPKFTIKIYQM